MKLSTQLLLAFSIIIFLSIMDTLSNYVLSLKVGQNTEFLNESQEIIRNSAALHKEIIGMQSSFRGFLATQDAAHLSDYKAGLKIIPPLFAEQSNLTKGNPEQSAILDSIKILHQQWIEYANSLIDASQKMAVSPEWQDKFKSLFENQFRKQIGKKINDEIAQKFLDFDKAEYQTRSLHSNRLISSIQYTHILSLTLFALTMIIGVSSSIYVVSLISSRIKTMVRLAESISKGEFTTLKDNRKDELTRLSAALNIMSGNLQVMSDNLKKNISELEKRNTELDKFAYVVSHDLKAPLRGIHNVTTWIEEDLRNEISPQMKNYLEIIPQRTKRMEDLINGLLDYARIRQKTEAEQTDVNKLVKEIVDAIVPRNFKVEIKKLPVMTTERLKLEQVFSNIISNAVKYTTGASPEIIISCKEVDQHFEFSVKDNGIGIEPQYHEKIFEMFQTLREKDEKESTGIGLAITKRILDEQHGIIYVNSALGKGAEFIFTWPRVNKK